MERDNGQFHDTSEYRRVVLGLVRGRLDQMVTMMLDAVLFLPGYTSDFRPSRMEDERSSMRHTAECFLNALAEERPLSQGETLSLTIIGSRRAHLPYEVLMAGVAAACDVVLDFLLDVARDVPAPGAVALAAVQWFRAALSRFRQEAADAMRVGHVNEQGRAPQTLANRRIWLVDRLLYGLWDDQEELAREAVGLGCELSPPFALLLVTAAGNTDLDGLRRAATKIADDLPMAIEGPARPFPTARHVVVLVPRHSVSGQAVFADTLSGTAQAAVLHVLVPDPAVSLTALPTVYSRTTRDLSLPARMKLPPGIVSADDLSYYRIITRAPPDELADLATRFVGPLLRGNSTNLIETLEVLRRSPDVASAAAALGKHENTVYQHMRRITEKTGCDLRVQAEAEKVFTGLLLRFAIEPDALGDDEKTTGDDS